MCSLGVLSKELARLPSVAATSSRDGHVRNRVNLPPSAVLPLARLVLQPRAIVHRGIIRCAEDSLNQKAAAIRAMRAQNGVIVSATGRQARGTRHMPVRARFDDTPKQRWPICTSPVHRRVAACRGAPSIAPAAPVRCLTHWTYRSDHRHVHRFAAKAAGHCAARRTQVLRVNCVPLLPFLARPPV